MYLCTMEDVDVLHMFLSVHGESSRRITCVLPVYDGLRGRITCGLSCARWTTWTHYLYFQLCMMDLLNVLPVFLPVHDELSVYITCIFTCARWTTWTYYTYSYLFIVDQVDVLPVFLPVHDILSVYIPVFLPVHDGLRGRITRVPVISSPLVTTTHQQ